MPNSKGERKRSTRPAIQVQVTGAARALFHYFRPRDCFLGDQLLSTPHLYFLYFGTLFLDEVGDIPLGLQVKLLRLIETGTYRPVGSSEPRRSDFRLICATHKDLWQMVEAGEFRQDLYFRINVFPIAVPSLAERIDDIPLIANSLLAKLSKPGAYHLTESALVLLKTHAYIGNVRELRNILSRAIVLANANVIDHRLIAECLEINPEKAATEVDLRTLEQDYLARLMRAHNNDRQTVAQIAGISVRTLYRKLGLARELT